MKTYILGSGSWGTALAQVLAENNQDVTIWGINDDEVSDINDNHQNTKYFDDVILDTRIKATTDFNCISDADIVLLAIPTNAIEEICKKLTNVIEKKVIVINVAKGFHPDTHERLSVTIKNSIPSSKLIDVVSLIGPSHAEEVVLGLLTSINAVCENIDSAIVVQKLFSNNKFRVYTNTDVVGAEVGVALKNIMAIASGILSGLNQGDNARAALMTRGLAEISRYGIKQGAKPETYLGLTGVGDLIVTCTSKHSRNFQAGYKIGTDNSSEKFWKENKKTVEGVNAVKVIYLESIKQGIDMPITAEIYRVLYEGKKPDLAIKELMSRDLKSE
ncbi:MAG: NAD(P)H-dependent glycerol-3-phosphate dehydrogenase [Anaerorhabdus sp.]